MAPAPGTAQRRARPVQRQFQGQGFAAQALAPVLQLPLGFTGFQPQALPNGEVGVLHRQRRQVRRALVLAPVLIGAGHLAHQDRQRPGITDDVMGTEQQHMFLGPELDQGRPQQQVVLQVEGAFALLRHLFGHLWAGVLKVAVIQPLQEEFALRMNHLHHLLAVQAEGAAQHLMAVDQVLDTALQISVLQVALQAQHRQLIVGAGGGLQLPEKPQALLGIGRAHQRLVLAAPRDRQQVQGQPLLDHLALQGATLLGAERGEPLGQRQHALG
ncbi:hypothetical protein PproGo58_39590 [Pseudomonas protegens]|nr:hypothetical protein PproGo58_39590 [Pseudomonas protegens]